MSSYDLASELDGMTPEQLGTKLYAKGTYAFVVLAAAEAETTNQNPCLRLKVAFIDGPYQGLEISKDVIYSNAKTTGVQFFWRQLQGLGLESEYLTATGQTKFSQIAPLLIGAQFEGKIDHREFPPNSGQERLDMMIQKPIGENPNVSNGAVTGVVQPPENDPMWADDDDAGTASEAAVSATEDAVKETVPTGVAAAAGESVDDPWGTDSK